MDWIIILTELTYRTSRSSGAGGQHVNKTETKVEVLFNVAGSAGLSEEEKGIIALKLAARINDEGILSVTSQKTRSQLNNKEDAVDRLNQILEKALKPVVKRIRTKPSKSSVEERLAAKKIQADKKEGRKKPEV